ncbi:MAG: sugar phosphate isomerase/epimerase [Lentisphaerae bacterium]|nr:sugar phosphate isomerase/epimerase [Lentisphaerota bacterium]
MKNILQINGWTVGGFNNEKPVMQVLADVAAMGLDGVELAFGAGDFNRGISEAQCQAIRRKAESLKLRIATLSTGYYWGNALSTPDAAKRREAVEFTKEYLRVAAWVGAEAVLVIPGAVAVPWDPSRPAVPYATVWQNATASVRGCIKEAEKRKVTLALENVWGWFLTDPMAMKCFVDQFKSRRVGVYFDVANCLINGFPEHWIEILGKRIAALHFKNFTRQDCGGNMHGFGDDLFKGDVNWKAVLSALAKIKYKGPITVEMLPFSRLPNLVMPDLPLARAAAEQLKQVMALAR